MSTSTTVCGVNISSPFKTLSHLTRFLDRTMVLPQVAKKQLCVLVGPPNVTKTAFDFCFFQKSFTSAHYVHPKKCQRCCRLWTLPFLFPVQADREYDKKFDSNCFQIMTVSSSQLELCPPLDEPKLLRFYVYIFPKQRRYHVTIFYFWYFKGLLLGILRSALFFFSSLLSLLRILSSPFSFSLRCFWRKIRWITNRRFCRPKILSRNKFLFKSWTRSLYWMLAVKLRNIPKPRLNRQ